jgi:CheY-like chemotaxis protein
MPSGQVILLVEDHNDSRIALATILRKRKYEVVECGSVQEAMSVACSRRFSLLISDIELPDGSGFGLMKELGQLYGLRGIAVSGLYMEIDRARSRSAGFAFHLKKPVNVRDLEAAIQSILAEAKGVVP